MNISHCISDLINMLPDHLGGGSTGKFNSPKQDLCEQSILLDISMIQSPMLSNTTVSTAESFIKKQYNYLYKTNLCVSTSIGPLTALYSNADVVTLAS